MGSKWGDTYTAGPDLRVGASIAPYKQPGCAVIAPSANIRRVSSDSASHATPRLRWHLRR